MAAVIVGFAAGLPRRIRTVGARGVVHTLQFNGKQGEVEAFCVPQVGVLKALRLFNLRCPRNGKTDENRHPKSSGFQFSSTATELLDIGFYTLVFKLSGRR